jgi:hypothetical protein
MPCWLLHGFVAIRSTIALQFANVSIGDSNAATHRRFKTSQGMGECSSESLRLASSIGLWFPICSLGTVGCSDCRWARQNSGWHPEVGQQGEELFFARPGKQRRQAGEHVAEANPRPSRIAT